MNLYSTASGRVELASGETVDGNSGFRSEPVLPVLALFMPVYNSELSIRRAVYDGLELGGLLGLQQVGLEPEGRKFSPHITIARFKNPHAGKVASYMAAHNLFELPSYQVDEFHLYSSILRADGAIHTIEASFPFGIK